jgi:hypothetical protein
VPEDSLTPQVLIGLGIGRDPTSGVNPLENGNPVWVTPVGNGNTFVTVYVDFDADAATGPLTDPNGNKYDVALSLRELDRAKVFDTGDRNQTGMLLYTLAAGVKLAAAWGQDPAAATAARWASTSAPASRPCRSSRPARTARSTPTTTGTASSAPATCCSTRSSSAT